MNYWDAILYEVLNQDDDTISFLFTSIGEIKERIDESKRRAIRKESPSERVKLYPVGAPFDDIFLTRRELQCSLQLLKGHTMAGAAKLMGLSPRTLEFYIRNMKKKFACRTKEELIDKIQQANLMAQADHFE